jgi:GT2 family glycosyltransferase/glycosyltransferase involved in cell wall biosynthesis
MVDKKNSPLSQGNLAMRAGQYAEAIAHYAKVLIHTPTLGKRISANLSIARKKYRNSRLGIEKQRVAVCSWELAHNPAGRAYTLATIYKTFADVEIIGSLFPSFGGEIWEPIRDTTFPKHSFIVEDERKFIEQAILLVAAHPYDIVHLSKPRIPNIFFGILYTMLWDAKVLMDIDDEELAFVGAETPISIDDYIQQHGKLPEIKDLAGKDWTRLAVGMAKEFDGLTVCNTALQERYGGEIVRHARNEKLFNSSPELKRQSREMYGIPKDAKVVLFFGTPREHKGLIETAQAIASLKHPGLIYCIVGSFSDDSLKQRLSEVKGCTFKFLPNQPIRKTTEILAIADCCVLIQDTDSTAANFQTPAKLSDALSMGVKVMANRTLGLADLTDIPGIIFCDNKTLKDALGEQIFNLKERHKKEVKVCPSKFFSLDTARKSIQKALEKKKKDNSTHLVRLMSSISNLLAWYEIPIASQSICENNNKTIGSCDDLKNNLTKIECFYKRPTLIIPVYNAAYELNECLMSVFDNIDKISRVIVINDASTEDKVIDILKKYEGKQFLEIYHNSKNLGFSGTINRGLILSGDSDVIILNSDTRVTKGFCQRMMSVAYSSNNIGTVTPLSNNAGPFSIQLEEYEILEGRRLDLRASALARLSKRHRPEVPTAHGFCMYIRRDCINDVGFFDAKAFPRGYGEENDFCMRAQEKGWKHLLDDSTFVFHKKAASFKDDKDQLIKAGRTVLDQRYPYYTKLVRDFVKSKGLVDCLADAKRAFGNVDLSIDTEGARVLYVIPKLGAKGGTPQTNSDLMRGMRRLNNTKTFLLVSDGCELILSMVNDSTELQLEVYRLSNRLVPSSHESEEYDNVVIDWVLKYSFDVIHYRHLALHSLSVLPKLKNLNIRLIHSFHDFYTICPTVKLLDSNNKYCDGLCSTKESEIDCTVDVWRNNEIQKLRNMFIYEWNAKFTNKLIHFDAYITTSKSATALIKKRLPAIRSKVFKIIPHDFQNLLKPVDVSKKIDLLRVLIPGGINVAKGGLIIQELSRRLKGKVEFHVLGTFAKALGKPDGLVHHGEYERDDFINRVKELAPRMHIGAIFSIWPETYCHTLTELWAAGLPVLGIDYGAIGERISESGAGWLVQDNDIDRIVDFLLVLKEHPNLINLANTKLAIWQNDVGYKYNVHSMARQYNNVYNISFD